VAWWRHLAAAFTSVTLAFGAMAQPSLDARREGHAPAPSFAQQGPTEEELLNALKPVPRSSREFLPGSVEEQRFIDRIRTDRTRQQALNTPTPPIVSGIEKPKIDLEILFAYNIAEILSSSKSALRKLGTALTDPALKGNVFLIAGHTDARGGGAYTLDLSERRADAVKQFLTENFGIPSEDLIAVGYGKSRLKNPSDPLGAENRRIEITNLGGGCRRGPSSAPFC